jgi:hypothetical protein
VLLRKAPVDPAGPGFPLEASSKLSLRKPGGGESHKIGKVTPVVTL